MCSFSRFFFHARLASTPRHASLLSLSLSLSLSFALAFLGYTDTSVWVAFIAAPARTHTRFLCLTVYVCFLNSFFAHSLVPLSHTQNTRNAQCVHSRARTYDYLVIRHYYWIWTVFTVCFFFVCIFLVCLHTHLLYTTRRHYLSLFLLYSLGQTFGCVSVVIRSSIFVIDYLNLTTKLDISTANYKLGFLLMSGWIFFKIFIVFFNYAYFSSRSMVRITTTLFLSFMFLLLFRFWA